VLAASSLTDAFTDIGKRYEKRTGTRVTFSFAGSQELAAQVRQGAPADVLATADTATMQSVGGELPEGSRVFARNTLVVVVAPGNPGHVRSLADLSGVSLVLGDPSVPAGRYAAQALRDAHVSVQPRSLELDVRAVLTKVELGEADAGIVYATDARSAGDAVTSVPIAGSPVAAYPIAPLTDAGRQFEDYVVSPAGTAVLQHYGFLPP